MCGVYNFWLWLFPCARNRVLETALGLPDKIPFVASHGPRSFTSPGDHGICPRQLDHTGFRKYRARVRNAFECEDSNNCGF